MGLAECKAAREVCFLRISAFGFRIYFAAAALLLAVMVNCGCRKDTAAEAADSDANGYECLKCDAKLYTARSNFIGPQCPKCQADQLTEVVGYSCPKDNHLTILPRTNSRQTSPVCEKCQAPVSEMRLPREKDLKAWGATKVP